MAMALLGLGVLCWWEFLGPSDRATPAETDAGSAAVSAAAAADDSAATRPASVAPPSANAPSKTKIEAAKNYVDLKNYAMGEDLYKQVIASEPANVEALQGLASVLYREDKIDEAAAILDRIPK